MSYVEITLPLRRPLLPISAPCPFRGQPSTPSPICSPLSPQGLHSSTPPPSAVSAGFPTKAPSSKPEKALSPTSPALGPFLSLPSQQNLSCGPYASTGLWLLNPPWSATMETALFRVFNCPTFRTGPTLLSTHSRTRSAGFTPIRCWLPHLHLQP